MKTILVKILPVTAGSDVFSISTLYQAHKQCLCGDIEVIEIQRNRFIYLEKKHIQLFALRLSVRKFLFEVIKLCETINFSK